MNEVEIAWLAGLYEGEGTCVAQNQRGRTTMRLVIGMTRIRAEVLGRGVPGRRAG